MFKKETIEALQAKLDLTHVSKRDGAGGKKFDYLEQWFVIDEANRIFGHDGWSRETVRLELIGAKEAVDKQGQVKFKVAYRSTVKVTVGDTIREGSGFGNGQDSDELNAHELAMKEAESDAMKRAFMTFGNPFGLALYDKKRANVDDGKNFKTARERNALYEMIMADINAADHNEGLQFAWISHKENIARIKKSDDELFIKLSERKEERKKQFADIETALEGRAYH